MGEWLNNLTDNPNFIWALVAITAIGFAGFKAWLNHQERIAKIQAGMDPDKKD